MSTTIAQPDQLEAPEKALRWVFPDLKFTSMQITPDAAAYSFRVQWHLKDFETHACPYFSDLSLW